MDGIDAVILPVEESRVGYITIKHSKQKYNGFIPFTSRPSHIVQGSTVNVHDRGG